MPNVQSGTRDLGFAIGVYGNAWPITATSTPLTSRSTEGGKTCSPKSSVRTLCATNSIAPLSSRSTISRTRSAPYVNSQCPVITFTPSRRAAEVAQQPLADEMRRSVRRCAHAEVRAGLAVIHGNELRVAVREVQQGDVAERRRIIERLGGRLRASRRQRESGDGRRRENPDELVSR